MAEKKTKKTTTHGGVTKTVATYADISEAICSQETFFKLGRKFTSDKDTEAERTRAAHRWAHANHFRFVGKKIFFKEILANHVCVYSSEARLQASRMKNI